MIDPADGTPDWNVPMPPLTVEMKMSPGAAGTGFDGASAAVGPSFTASSAVMDRAFDERDDSATPTLGLPMYFRTELFPS